MFLSLPHSISIIEDMLLTAHSGHDDGTATLAKPTN
jgi:hypothetical protein